MLRPVFVAVLEVKRFLTDRGDLAFSLALPIALFALMYGAFGGGGVSFHGTAHVVDLDGGAAAQRLLSRLDAIDAVSVKYYSLEDADAAMDRAAVATVIVIPAGFTASLEAGQTATITLKQLGSGGEEGQIVSNIVRGVAEGVAAEYQVRAAVSQALAGVAIDAARVDAVVGGLLAEARAAPSVAVTAPTTDEGDTELVARMVPGILVMFLLFAVALNAQTLVEERRIGTLERLLTTRLSVGQLFLGKFLAGVLRATLQGALLLALGFVVFRIAGPLVFAQALAFAVLVAAAVSAIGLVIGSLAKTREQAAWSAVFITMSMVIFGGTFFEVGDSGPLAALSRITLNRYAVDALEAIVSESSSIAGQWPAMLVMVGVTVVGLAIARVAFRVSSGGR